MRGAQNRGDALLTSSESAHESLERKAAWGMSIDVRAPSHAKDSFLFLSYSSNTALKPFLHRETHKNISPVCVHVYIIIFCLAAGRGGSGGAIDRHR